MRMVYISLNRQFGELLRSSIEKHGVKLHLASSLSHAKRICENDIDIALVDYSLGVKNGVQIIHELQDSGRLIKSEIWLTAYGLSQKSPQISKAMSAVRASRFWSQPFSPFDLLDVLEKKRQPKKRVNFVPSSMRMIAQVWVHKTSGIVSAQGNRLIFSEGKLVRQDPSDALIQCLQNPILDFSPITGVDGGDWEKTGSKLYEIAYSGPPEKWIRSNQTKYTKIIDNSALYEVLNIDKVLMNKLTSNEKLSSFKMSSEENSIVYTLWIMGVLFFSDKPPVAKKKSAKQKEKKSFNVSAFRGRRTKVSDWLLTEYNRLKDASPSMILGVPEKAQSEMIQAAIKRMTKRYMDIVEDRTSDADTKALAQTMVDLVEKAGREFFQIDSSETPEHLQLLSIGQDLIGSKNWSKATKALTKAHQICIEDSSILAHLAWAKFNNEDLDQEMREKDAQESLLLAVHLDSDNVHALTFLSRMYLKLNRPDAAIGPIRRAAQLTPEPEIQSLRSEVEEALSAVSES